MAERVGFEPTILIAQDSGFRDRRLQPLGHLSKKNITLSSIFKKIFQDFTAFISKNSTDNFNFMIKFIYWKCKY